MGSEDQVILVTHQPRWLMDWFWEEAATHNLRQLVRGHLRGRARVHLAGGAVLRFISDTCSHAAKLECWPLCIQVAGLWFSRYSRELKLLERYGVQDIVVDSAWH